MYHLGYKPDVETYAMFYAADTDGDGDVSATTRRSLPCLCLEACRSQRMLTTFSLLSLQVDREEFEVLKPKLRRYAAEKASAEFPRQWEVFQELDEDCLLYTSPSPRD